MSAVLKPPRFADSEAYLAWEATQSGRHEYVSGEVYAMVGARAAHNTITFNAVFFLREALRGTPCRVHGIDFKLNVGPKGDFLYPDVMVSCDPRDLASGEDRFHAHPWLIVEVLSESTAAFDRGAKFGLYRQIDTLTHYLLVEQGQPQVDVYSRIDASRWELRPLSGADSIEIERLGRPWPVATLFEDVDFSVSPSTPAGA